MASLSASETEFLAEQELIVIMPHFHLRENNGLLNFISGDFGPFQPGITTHVPLWLAIMLKQLHKCRILAPSWLSVGTISFIESSLKQNGSI
ncbi:hypothetical protein KXD40_006795 [Peronospora effusa]|uniref:DNA replication complex GINS protein PSF2 N-terminal domain-containing protein n=1 Tax=Peronospora effusa TaxID=542832 RepID=A0A3M6VV70_9STRA|nr:hypothetical protein DD238_002482 [Peronospora effusa]RQM10736.1 hypothetical protein DD237_002282 [Peronospora effusa]UIZ24958.1 hypothetical protein KXD40_006795 [Peronospora effusa]